MFTHTEELPLALTCDDIQLVPGYSIVRSRSEDVKLHPYIYSAPMDRVSGYEMCEALLAAGEMAVLSRGLPVVPTAGQEQPDSEWECAVRDFASHPNFWIAVPGQIDQLKDMMGKLVDLKLDKENLNPNGWNFAVDIAVGHGLVADEAYEYLKMVNPLGGLMSGSIATSQAAIHCVNKGCTHLRVGVGPGSMCITRKVTGFGIPQWSTVRDIHAALNRIHPDSTYSKRKNTIIIADGGIRDTDDVAKLLAAGADAVMMGSVFSKCKESPGWQHVQKQLDLSGGSFRPGRNQYQMIKRYRGHASADFQTDNGKRVDAPEGVSTTLIWEGDTVETTLARHRAALRSAISYSGVSSLKDFGPNTVVACRVTQAGLEEATPHGVING